MIACYFLFFVSGLFYKDMPQDSLLLLFQVCCIRICLKIACYFLFQVCCIRICLKIACYYCFRFVVSGYASR